MVSTSELTMVVSTDTVDLVRFHFFFFTSAVWVAAMEAAAREADTFPAVYRVRHGAATLNGAQRGVAETSLSLPTVESETYSSTRGAGSACMSAASRTL
jgi:hypothetical protein